MIAPDLQAVVPLDGFVVRLVFGDAEIGDVDIEPLQGEPADYEREHAVDLAQRSSFLEATQRKFLSRVQGEIAKREVVNVLRNGFQHGAHRIEDLPPGRAGVEANGARAVSLARTRC